MARHVGEGILVSARAHHGLLLADVWSPSQLFGSGARGAWYDFNDLSTMFQDTLGTIPVTAVGQSVALVRDKSANHQDISQNTSGNRPVLQHDGVSYYLQFAAASSQWLERTVPNTLQPGTQSLLGLVANLPTSSASTAYSRAKAAAGVGRYTIGQVTSRADSGAYEWPTSNADAKSASVIATSVRNVMSQTIDRGAGINKVWYAGSGGAVTTGTSSVNIDTTDMSAGYRFRVGAYGNSSDSAGQSFWDGRIYGVIIVFQSSIDYSARDNAEAWMMRRYGF